MHIVIDAHLAVKKIDGIARYLIGLLSELPKIDTSIQYSILTLPEHKSSLPQTIFTNPNVRRIEFNMMGPSPKQHFIMHGLLRKLKADLYHHPQYDLPFGVKIPTVVTIHDLKYIYYPEFLTKINRLKSSYIRKSLAYSLNKADRIIAVSNSTLNDLTSFCPLPSKRIKVINHGVNGAKRTSLNQKKLPLDLANEFVLFVGTRRPHKNIEGLIKALAILRKNYKFDIDLVISGKAYSDYTEPEKLAKELEIDKSVHFLDFVPDTQLSALYQSAQLVALTSFYEGFGFPLLEAMSYGKPVVGSNMTSIPEVIGEAGLLVDPYDSEDIARKIHLILTDRSLYEELSKKALHRSKLFSWAAVARATLEVYKDALYA